MVTTTTIVKNAHLLQQTWMHRAPSFGPRRDTECRVLFSPLLQTNKYIPGYFLIVEHLSAFITKKVIAEKSHGFFNCIKQSCCYLETFFIALRKLAQVKGFLLH